MAEEMDSVDTIVSAIRCIPSHDELKKIDRAVARRAAQLTAEKAAMFAPDTKVIYDSGERRICGVVQRAEGSRVLVKLAHGFVARIEPDKLRRSVSS